jgi:hypothetical protein
MFSIVQIGFILSVVALFVVTLTIRLHFSPRAQTKRAVDFLSHAYGTPLSHEQTERYYNNSATTVPARIAAQVLENSFYSKDTASEMVRNERIKISCYVTLWIIAMLSRSTPLTTLAIVAQIMFSEQILSRWLRIEWFRIKCDKIFDDLYRLFQRKDDLEICAVELLVEYETVKATAGIQLSTNMFERNTDRTTREWQKIRHKLGI